VTGANRGIARALTDALLTQGVGRVYATARHPEALRDSRVIDRQIRLIVANQAGAPSSWYLV
jgi:hypothetical protein